MIEASLIKAISAEIEKGNAKHGHGPLATDLETVAILAEELGEYSQAILKTKPNDEIENELLQIAAVAINHLQGSGPHISNK